ncbi:MAG: PfkB family carbohydrate kinase [Pyrinomonadaceae bacterium]
MSDIQPIQINGLDAEDILARLSAPRIAVVGDVMLDRYWKGSVSRVSPEAPVPVLHLEDEFLIPGGAANVAANIAGLGATATLVSLIGHDYEGELLSKRIIEFGIDTSGIGKSVSRPTTVKNRLLAGHQQIARADRESCIGVDLDEFSILRERLHDSISGCDAIVVSDYGKGLISESLMGEIMSTANEAGIPVLADPKGLNFEKYRGARLLTPNKKEALEVSALFGSDLLTIDEIGNSIIENYGIDSLLITLGAEGMALFEKGAPAITIEALERNVFDVTGAGDTVISVLALGIASGFSVFDSAVIANLAAGVVIEKVGTSAISQAQLLTALHEFNPNV